MKTSRFSDSQIIAILKQAEAGSPVPELCREHGISSATFYKWRSKFGGMGAIADGPAQGTRRREPAPQEDVCRRATQGRDCPGGAAKKVVKPSCRREMVQQTVENGVSTRVARLAFGISKTCCRYQAKLSAESVEIGESPPGRFTFEKIGFLVDAFFFACRASGI